MKSFKRMRNLSLELGRKLCCIKDKGMEPFRKQSKRKLIRNQYKHLLDTMVSLIVVINLLNREGQ